MDSNFRFLVVRPSNRHGRRDCCLENGSGSVGEPKVRIHLPPAQSPLRTCPTRLRRGEQSAGRYSIPPPTRTIRERETAPSYRPAKFDRNIPNQSTRPYRKTWPFIGRSTLHPRSDRPQTNQNPRLL